MRKYFVWAVMILGFIACQKNEEGLLEKEEEKVSPEKAALSAKLKAWELLSVTDDMQVSLEEAKRQALAMAYQMQSQETVSGVSLFARSSPISIEHVEELTDGRAQQVYRNDSKETDFYLIHFSNDKGYALVSADKRVPGVMAYNSSGDMDTDNNPGQAIMFSAIQNYVAVQKELYEKKKDSLKQSALKKFKEHLEKQRLANPKFMASADKSIGDDDKDRGKGCSLDDIYISEDVLVNEPWIIIEQKNPLLKTMWGQQDAYNNLVSLKCLGDEAPVGCVATAVGQIMAYHKKPYIFKGQVMHWIDMTPHEYSTINNVSSTAVRDIQHLLARLGDKDLLNMHYGCGSSGTYDKEVIKTFKSLGYNVGYIEKAYHDKIINNILSNKPVYVSGCDSSTNSCHAWVLDGYMEKSKKTLYFRYIECPKGHVEREEIEGSVEENFVHCNFGWKGDASGWYRMNIFDTNIHKKYPSIRYPIYDCYLDIITNIY